MLNIAVVIICVIIGVPVIRMICIRAKRKMRVGELRHHVDMILNEDGDDSAPRRVGECVHIVEHYGANLHEAGFKGSLENLRYEAIKSFNRAELRRSTINSVD